MYELYILEPRNSRLLLALDGGGLRGMLSVQILRRIETLLRDRYNDPALVLTDYFDLPA